MSGDHELHKNYIQIWERAVQTQMHFNDMSVKARQYGLAFVGGALGLAAVLLQSDKNYSITVYEFTLHGSVVVVVVSLLALNAVRQVDLHVYHMMLRGAVKFGEDFERNYMSKIFQLNKGMTEAITHYSQYIDADTKDHDGRNTYIGSNKTTAYIKIVKFYRLGNIVLSSIATILFLVTNPKIIQPLFG